MFILSRRFLRVRRYIMHPDIFSTANLDYLQRVGFKPVQLPANTPMTEAPPALRRLLHIGGIGRMEKVLPPNPRQAGQPAEPEQPTHMLSEDILTGLYGYKIPLAFLVLGQPGKVAINMGIWSPVNRGNLSGNLLAVVLD